MPRATVYDTLVSSICEQIELTISDECKKFLAGYAKCMTSSIARQAVYHADECKKKTIEPRNILYVFKTFCTMIKSDKDFYMEFSNAITKAVTDDEKVSSGWKREIDFAIRETQDNGVCPHQIANIGADVGKVVCYVVGDILKMWLLIAKDMNAASIDDLNGALVINSDLRKVVELFK